MEPYLRNSSPHSQQSATVSPASSEGRGVLQHHMPIEVVQMIFLYAVPNNNQICVATEGEKELSQKPPIELMSVCKKLGDVATQIYYGNNCFCFSTPSADLPFFLERLRKESFHAIRQVELEWPDNGLHEDSLDMLSVSKSLESLKIDDRFFAIQRQYHPSLKGFRLKYFGCTRKSKALSEIISIITGDKKRTSQQESRQEKAKTKLFRQPRDFEYYITTRESTEEYHRAIGLELFPPELCI